MATGLCFDEKVLHFLDPSLDVIGENRGTGHGEVDGLGVPSLCGLSCLCSPTFSFSCQCSAAGVSGAATETLH